MEPIADEALSRLVLRELLRTPAVAHLLRSRIAQAPPPPAGPIVDDPELALGLALSALRGLDQAAAQLAELGRLAERLPEPMLAGLAARARAELHPEVWAEAFATWGRLAERLLEAEPESRRRLDAAAARLVDSGLRGLGRLLGGQPGLARALTGLAARVVWTGLVDLIARGVRLPGRAGREG